MNGQRNGGGASGGRGGRVGGRGGAGRSGQRQDVFIQQQQQPGTPQQNFNNNAGGRGHQMRQAAGRVTSSALKANRAPVQKHVGNDMNDDSETRFGAGHQGGKPTVKVQVKEEVDSNFVIIKRIPDQEFKEICPDNKESFTEFDKFLMSRLLGSSCLIDKEAITKIDLLFIKIRDKGVLTSAEINEDEEIERNPKSELNFLKEHHFWDQNQKMLQIRQKCWEELKDYADFDNNSMISKNEFRMFFIQKALLVDIDPVDTQEAKNKKVELNLHLPKEYKESIHRRKSAYDHLEEWHRHFNVRLQNFIKIFKMRHHYGE